MYFLSYPDIQTLKTSLSPLEMCLENLIKRGHGSTANFHCKCVFTNNKKSLIFVLNIIRVEMTWPNTFGGQLDYKILIVMH